MIKFFAYSHCSRALFKPHLVKFKNGSFEKFQVIYNNEEETQQYKWEDKKIFQVDTSDIEYILYQAPKTKIGSKPKPAIKEIYNNGVVLEKINFNILTEKNEFVKSNF